MYKLAILLTSSLVMALYTKVVNAQEYEHCYQILEKNGPFDFELIKNNNAMKSFAHRWFCRQSYQDDGSSKSINIEGVYKALSGSINYSQDKHSEYQNGLCNEDTQYKSVAEKTHIIRQLTSPEIVNAWRDCIAAQNGGLVCDAEQPSKDELRFQITVQNGPHNDLLSADIMKDNIDFVFNEDSRWNGSINEGGSRLIHFRRINPLEPALIQINGNFEDNAASCDYRIPPYEYVDVERINIWQLVSEDRLPSGVVAGDFHRSDCHIQATETLKIKHSTVASDKSNIAVSYECNRPDSRHKCGAGQWSPRVDYSYSASVNADISVSNGVLSIDNVEDSVPTKLAPETGCGKRIVQYIQSLQGTSVDVH